MTDITMFIWNNYNGCAEEKMTLLTLSLFMDSNGFINQQIDMEVLKQLNYSDGDSTITWIKNLCGDNILIIDKGKLRLNLKPNTEIVISSKQNRLNLSSLLNIKGLQS